MAVTLCFDLDGVICSQTDGAYEDAVPNRAAIALINRLHDEGQRIIIHTSRFMGRAKEDPARAGALGLDFTKKQLAEWGVKYDALHMGKPRYDVLVDDRAVFFEDDWSRIAADLDAFVARRG